MLFPTLLTTAPALQENLRPGAFGSWIIIGSILILALLIGGFERCLRHRRP